MVSVPGIGTPLTPTSFLLRAARVHPLRLAIIDGVRSFTYREFASRSRQGAGMLARLGIQAGDRVGVLCSNSAMMLELHHAVPMAGGVLVALNTRLAEEELAYILEHSGSRILAASREFADIGKRLSRLLGLPLILEDAKELGDGSLDYEETITSSVEAEPARVSEGSLLAINYTSGTTGRPKGVMYHHRGAYLQAVGRIYHGQLDSSSVYLWTLPMFHCNGWCHTWALSAAASTHICLRTIDPELIWRYLKELNVSHFSAAPTVLTMIAQSPDAAALPQPIRVDTGGAPPTPILLSRLADLNMSVTHLYGLTETFGPIGINEWKLEWDRLPGPEQARLRARQGVSNVIAEPLRVIDSSGVDVPADGATVGEIAAHGNTVMLGYFRDPDATAKAFLGDWFLTGDLAVMHPDGYLEIVDRRKDIIISGGENISSVEVERVLDAHPAVLESAVIAVPDPRWGEVPHAFISLRDGMSATPVELDTHVRAHLAGFKAPKQYFFGPLPKTGTGKIRKNVLRESTHPVTLESPRASQERSSS